ncbi:DUF411 domain-containing protein [Nitrincola sp. MINF-07-Sa-05]|uniref:DUF411 domain-containing protein n=1 Tax=Nitrincola salilacus TaxID=3400273 RepID=UPI003917E79B
MRSPSIILAAFLSSVVLTSTANAESVMQVYKSEFCGCCKDWITHVESAGIKVEAVNIDDLNGKKAELGLPQELSSCHTGVIDGYLVEGHVPADDILRLLRERPAIKGLSVPGMPHGSPGMETGRLDHYKVFAFDQTGKQPEVWSEYNQ